MVFLYLQTFVLPTFTLCYTTFFAYKWQMATNKTKEKKEGLRSGVTDHFILLPLSRTKAGVLENFILKIIRFNINLTSLIMKVIDQINFITIFYFSWAKIILNLFPNEIYLCDRNSTEVAKFTVLRWYSDRHIWLVQRTKINIYVVYESWNNF